MKNRRIKNLLAKRNIINVDELNALQVAYGKPLDYKDYFSYVGLPMLALFGLSFIVLYNFWYSLVFGIIGIVYGLKVILPKTIQRNYEQQAFFQRNKFVNSMTQILTDEGKTVQRALETVKQRASGEFREDLILLQGQTLATTNKKVIEAIQHLTDKYVEDIVFVQYMEQLETGIIEGETDVETLKDIKEYHNDINKKQNGFYVMKDREKNYMKTISIAMVAFVLIINVFLGLDTYINVFTKSPIGWITGTGFLGLEMMYYRDFIKYYYDDSIMEVSI